MERRQCDTSAMSFTLAVLLSDEDDGNGNEKLTWK